MQPKKILALFSVAGLIWSCDQSVQPTAQSPNESRIVPAINSVTSYAARQSGLAVATVVPVDPQPTSNPFNAEALQAMKDAGLCDNFVQLIAEISQSANPTTFDWTSSPRFQNVVSCIETDVSAWANAKVTPDVQQVMDEVDKCFCNGSGSIFSGIHALTLNRYSAPSTAGSQPYSAPSTSSSPYSAPTSTSSSYSAPTTAPGYSAPSL